MDRIWRSFISKEKMSLDRNKGMVSMWIEKKPASVFLEYKVTKMKSVE